MTPIMFHLDRFPTVRVIPVDKQAGGFQPTISMAGWDWFVLLGCTYQIDNTAGGTPANALVGLLNNNITVALALSAFQIGAGGIANVSGGIGFDQANDGNNTATFALPWMINVTPSSINIGWTFGDGATVMNGATLLVGGEIHRNVRG